MDIKVSGGARRVKLTKTERGYFEKVRELCGLIAANLHGELSVYADELADAAGELLLALDKHENGDVAPVKVKELA